MESLIGKTLGTYEIISELGRGGMAVVYKAYQRSLERFVALKVLPPQFTFDAEFVRRFSLEAKAAAKLKHTNIVTIYDVGEQNGLYYIVMELLDGASLAQVLQREGALAPARVTHIVAQIAAALDYAHACGFVHRDVKPSNIIIGSNDHATLTDFGIVKAAEGTRVTKSGMMIGTPEYIAPEQIRGQAVDARADVYALGVVCYEMLTGRVPFQGDTARVLYAQVHEPPPALHLVNPRVSLTIEQVVNTALAKDPAQRFARAGEFANALGSAVRGITAAPPPVPEPPTRYVPRPQRGKQSIVLPLSLAGIIGIVVLLCVISINLTRIDFSRSQPLSTPNSRSPSSLTTTLSASLTETLARFSKEEREIKQITFTPSGGWLVLGDRNYLTGTTGSVPDNLEQTLARFSREGREIKQITFTPSGSWLVLGDRNYWTGTTGSVPGNLEETLARFSRERREIKQITFTPRGSWLVLGDRNYWTGTTGSVPGNLEETLARFSRERREIRQIVFAPSGSWFVLGDKNYWTGTTGSVPPALEKALDQFSGTGREIKQIVFAPNGTWFILWDKNSWVSGAGK